MKKIITLKEAVPVLVIALMFITAWAFYQAPCFPERIPSHWNAAGQVDGWSGKNFALLFAPLLAIGVYLLLLLLPLVDPLRKNYEQFALNYYFIRLALIIFLAGLYFFTIFAAYYPGIKINFFIIPFLCLLFMVLGLNLPKIKKNYFVGIRTPWTLQNDEVWQETHQFGGKTMLGAGLLGFLALLLGKYGFWFFIIIISLGGLAPVAYSYYIYRKLGLFKK